MLWHKTIGAGGQGGASLPIEYVGGYVEGFSDTSDDMTVTLTSLTGGIDSAPSAGDFVLVYFGTGATTDRNLVVIGFTEIVELYERRRDYATNLVAAYKFMGASPDTSLILDGIPLSNSDSGVVAVQVWRNVNASTPLDVPVETASVENTVLCDPPAITPISGGAVVVAGGASAHGRNVETYSSSDLTGFISVGANNSNDATIGLGYHFWSSGSFDPAQFTFSDGDDSRASCCSITLALRPA